MGGGIRAKCLDAQVPFFFKQWAGVNKKKAGRHLNPPRVYLLNAVKKIAKENQYLPR